MENRKPYPSDVSDEEWAFVAPYLTLFPLDAGQRKHSLREVFNAVRYVVRCGCPWRMLPNDLPPWSLCRIPSDHIPIRSWPLFLARELMRDLIETLKAEQST